MKTKPRLSILDQRFQYRDSASTDVQKTWRRHGWTKKPRTPEPQQNAVVRPLERKKAAGR